MKRYGRQIIYLLLIFTAFISCKKNGTSNYPIKFYGERVEVKTSTRLFSHNGEIKNPSEIAAFVNGSEYFNAENDQSGKGVLALQLPTPDSAIFGQEHFKYSIKRSDNQFLFYSSVGAGIPNANTADFKLNLLKYTYSAPSPGPLGTFNTVREVKVAYGTLKELRFKRMAYLAASRSGASFSSIGGLANNEFNEAALAMMRDGDLLAIKLYEVVYKAK